MEGLLDDAMAEFEAEQGGRPDDLDSLLESALDEFDIEVSAPPPHERVDASTTNAS